MGRARNGAAYRCTNEACTLGSRKQPGVFVGGATKEQITLMTGDPEPEHFGDGVCPNCGEPGEAYDAEVDLTPTAGSDPNQAAHDAIAARVADPDDELKAEDAQHALHEVLGEERS